MKIYLAGKIAKGDWRHLFVPTLRTITTPGIWQTTTRVPMRYGHTYTGPFFIACDHGCFHGNNKHGAGAVAGQQSPNAICRAMSVAPAEVIDKAFNGIRRCDYMVVWADSDFTHAYGTHAEIGLAKAMGKKIAIIKESHVGIWDDLWFVLGLADVTQEADTVEEGVGKMLKFLETRGVK
jgi:hypothetical protein